MNHSDFSSIVLRWYAANGRQLPWRGLGDAYAIWLSEIILQQTRISQGMAYWHRFMQTYPTVEALAAASEDEVLKLWQGLGYYSRARNLHAAAQQIVAMGGFPSTYEAIRRLRGVGDYTAAAIASMAFGLPHAAVDGNVYRVLARYQAIDTPINSTTGKREFQLLANHLCPPQQAGDWNQAMMDFGAMQCTPTSPRCQECPLAEGCQAWRSGRVAHYPVKQRRVVRHERHFTFYYIERAGKVLFARRGKGDIWQGLWQPVLVETDQPHTPSLPATAVVRHVLTHQTIYARMVRIDANHMSDDDRMPESLPTLGLLAQDYHWASPQERATYALPRLVERLLEMMVCW